MFFANAGRLLAWIGFWAGALFVVVGFYLASQVPADPQGAAEVQAFFERRYGATSGEWIDRGIYFIFGSIVLGMVSSTALALMRQARKRR